MGVPALFRWLSKKYPKIVLKVKEDAEPDNGRPVDITTTNPNGQEFDNLYLDFNGIVHPCTHPEGKPAPETEEEMMVEIFKYTERLVNMVRPRKLLVIAVDGVAPRAKMNQQRSRRFRTAMDARFKAEEREAAIAEWQSMGRDVSEKMQESKAWDSNAITPGTPFMDLLAASMRYWVARKLNTDPGWRDLKVIISDASVPGEGEHKIMDLIRRQRAQADYDPNTTHVMYGLDADLIMLSLATHEPHFKVLREDVFADDRKRRGGGCHRCGQPGHHSSTCRGEIKPKEGDFDGKTAPPDRKPFIFLDVAVLREYLEIELDIPNMGFPFDLERAIDDWVFMIFFVGNDFLPHLPSLDIREGAVDTLLRIWRDSLPKMRGYLTEHGNVNLERAQHILDGLAAREDDIFRKRREAEERQNHGEKRRRVEHQRSMPQIGGMQNTAQDFVQIRSLASSVPASAGHPNLPTRPESVVEPSLGPTPAIDRQKAAADNLSAAQRLKMELAGEPVPADNTEDGTAATLDAIASSTPIKLGRLSGANEVAVAANGEGPRGTKRTADEAGMPATRSEVEQEGVKTVEEQNGGDAEMEDASAAPAEPATNGYAAVTGKTPGELRISGNTAEQEDTVKLWEPGYKDRYYRQKFGIELGDHEFRNNVVKSYIEGLCWVLQYYYQGCPSWHWYYPYHFAPFASDFEDLAKIDIKFELGTPVNPIEQLMSVFPAASRQHIPSVFHDLMTEPESEIIDFYPERFHIDMNGKKMIWQGVALLPFIERDRLLAALEPRYARLDPFETRRNTRGSEVMFVNDENPLYDSLIQLYMGKKGDESLPLDSALSKGLNGTAVKNENFIPSSTYDSPLTDVGLEDLVNDRSLSVLYKYPDMRTPHRSVLLKNFKRQRRVLAPDDVRRTKQMAEQGPDYDDRQDRGQRFGPGSGFHANRREIDGIGVRRSGDDFDRRRPMPPRGRSRSPPPFRRDRSPPPLRRPRSRSPPPGPGPGFGYRGRSPPPPLPPHGRRSPPPFLRDSFDQPPPRRAYEDDRHLRFDDRGGSRALDRGAERGFDPRYGAPPTERDYRRDPYDPRYDGPPGPPPVQAGYGGYGAAPVPPHAPPAPLHQTAPVYGDRGGPAYGVPSAGSPGYGRDPYAGYDASPYGAPPVRSAGGSANGYGSPPGPSYAGGYDSRSPPPAASPYGVVPSPYAPPAPSPYGQPVAPAYNTGYRPPAPPAQAAPVPFQRPPPGYDSYPAAGRPQDPGPAYRAPAPAPAQPAPPPLSNRDAMARSLPPHLLASAGQRAPTYRR